MFIDKTEIKRQDQLPVGLRRLRGGGEGQYSHPLLHQHWWAGRGLEICHGMRAMIA